LKNNVIVLSVAFVHDTELQNFLIAPRTFLVPAYLGNQLEMFKQIE